LGLSSALEAARRAEAAGFGIFSVQDHLVPFPAHRPATESVPDPFAVLGAAAVATEGILLASLVINTSLRHPAHIAKWAATLSELSSGRFILGLGSGGYAPDYVAAGVARPSRAERALLLEATLRHLRGQWSEKADTPRPLPVPVPKILVAGNADTTLEIAARHADLCNFAMLDEDALQRRIVRLSEYHTAAGSPRRCRVTLLTRVVAASSPDQAREKAKLKGARANLVGDTNTLERQLDVYQRSGVDAVFCMFDDEQSFDLFAALLARRSKY
jgi:alkanesulfonate monooxygenase SsuD/methylene tetrahydromethanopterin reductase-like flavin-dependent oxidoreductase (luciferase family)